jgi:1,2-diacylglycerol 3-alpha-glucosyltransferase
MKNRNNKLKILIALESYPPQITGSGIATKRIAKRLSDRGHHVEVVCPGNSIRYSRSVEDGVVVHRLNSIPIPYHRVFRSSFFPAFTMDRIFDELKPDIIHIADHLFIGRAAWSSARKNNIRIVGTNHFTPYNWIPNLGIKDRAFIPGMVEKILWTHFAGLFKKIDIITTPTEAARKIIQLKGIESPIKVISNGIDLSMFSGDRPGEQELKKYGLDPGRMILLSASRLDREKRVDLLIDALGMIKEAADFQLIITGTGKELDNLKKRTIDNGLSGRVVFTGIVPEETLNSFYRSSHIFITASEVELQGLSIMEAMAAGLPVVAARSMAIPELVRNGKNGFLFEPGDIRGAAENILRLLEDDPLRQELARNSLDIIKDHDFEKVLDRFETIYYENALA